MEKKELYRISNLGTIEGIKEIQRIVGKEYTFPKVSFFSVEEGIYSLENSHFVMKDCALFIDEEVLRIEDRNRKMEFLLTKQRVKSIHLGTKYGTRQVDELNYIEFGIDDYYMELYFYSK